MTAFGERLRATVPQVVHQTVPAESPRPSPRPPTAEECRAAEQRYAAAVAAAEVLVRDVFRPLVEEFQAVMESGGVFCPGHVQAGRVRDGAPWCSYQATGTAHQVRGEAPKRRDYSIRISAAVFRNGPFVLSVECRHGATRACRYSPPRAPLVTLDPHNVSAEALHHESARQWCADRLEKCAEACRGTNSALEEAAEAARSANLAPA